MLINDLITAMMEDQTKKPEPHTVLLVAIYSQLQYTNTLLETYLQSQNFKPDLATRQVLQELLSSDELLRDTLNLPPAKT